MCYLGCLLQQKQDAFPERDDKSSKSLDIFCTLEANGRANREGTQEGRPKITRSQGPILPAARSLNGHGVWSPEQNLSSDQAFSGTIPVTRCRQAPRHKHQTRDVMEFNPHTTQRQCWRNSRTHHERRRNVLYHWRGAKPLIFLPSVLLQQEFKSYGRINTSYNFWPKMATESCIPSCQQENGRKKQFGQTQLQQTPSPRGSGPNFTRSGPATTKAI